MKISAAKSSNFKSNATTVCPNRNVNAIPDIINMTSASSNSTRRAGVIFISIAQKISLAT